jgi:hypothetical protein
MTPNIRKKKEIDLLFLVRKINNHVSTLFKLIRRFLKEARKGKEEGKEAG